VDGTIGDLSVDWKVAGLRDLQARASLAVPALELRSAGRAARIEGVAAEVEVALQGGEAR
jgi:hypothetical protein